VTARWCARRAAPFFCLCAGALKRAAEGVQRDLLSAPANEDESVSHPRLLPRAPHSVTPRAPATVKLWPGYTPQRRRTRSSAPRPMLLSLEDGRSRAVQAGFFVFFFCQAWRSRSPPPRQAGWSCASILDAPHGYHRPASLPAARAACVRSVGACAATAIPGAARDHHGESARPGVKREESCRPSTPVRHQRHHHRAGIRGAQLAMQ